MVSLVIADAGGFTIAEGLTILLPAAILFAVSMAAAALWNRRHIADLQGRTDAATAAWRKAEARFGTLLEFSPDPTLAIDRRGRIRAAGKGLERAFGLPRAAVLRQSIAILSPDFETVLPRAMLAKLASGESPEPAGGDAQDFRLDQGIRFEVMARRKNGSPFPAEGVVFRLEDDGHLLGMVLRDVTERRNVERELRTAKEAAEIADRSKSEFLANMSHELRTPLNAIIGFADIIEAQSFGPEDPRYARYAHDISASGRHLLGVLKDILDFARIETRNATLHEAECTVGDLVETCLRMLRLRADQSEIAIAVVLPDDLPQLYVDAVKLKQVLINLLSNAIKFTPRGGEVRVTARILPDQSFAIVIADTGIGMRSEDIPLAMAPFGQIASAFSRGHDGLGLGLPLARQLVELHGGRLEISSQLGSGTVVSVLLPRDRVVVAPPVRHAAAV
jgi:PAS domain S-box-containing protein